MTPLISLEEARRIEATWQGSASRNGLLAGTAISSPDRAIRAGQEAAKILCQRLGKQDLANEAKSVVLTRGSDIRPEPVQWLWREWIAAGKVHIVGGAPGTGKTTIALSLAAIITSGGCWPDGSRSPLGNVLIWSGEDDPKDTLVPRLSLCGADLTRVFFVTGMRTKGGSRSFDPAKDMEALCAQADAVGNIRLLVVDPIVSAISGDGHKNSDVRRGLQPLVDLAASIGCAVLGVTHFTKGTSGRDPIERLTGSLAFGALARVVFVAARPQDDDEGQAARLFLRAKSNVGPDDGGFEYNLTQGELELHPGVYASVVLWGPPVTGKARDILAVAEATGDDGEGGTLADAKRFLMNLLGDGPVSVKAIKSDAEGAGYSWVTIKRAKKAIGAEASKGGMSAGWTWSLHRRGSTSIEGDQQNLMSPFGKNDPLRYSIEVEP
jgi:putative DNA primase/helicase